jgi:hypothetical protein
MRGTDEVWPLGSNMIRPAEVVIDLAAPMYGKDYATPEAFAEACRLKMGKMYAALLAEA